MKSNWTRAEVTTADIPGLLSLLTNSGIELRDVRNTDSLHIRFLIKGSQLQALHAIANKREWGSGSLEEDRREAAFVCCISARF